MAGELGLEPRDAGAKGPCLTIWLLPNFVTTVIYAMCYV